MLKFAYITLLTKASYLAGVIVLAHSLHETSSSYPLIVCYTPSLPEDCVQALAQEANHGVIILRSIDPLQPTDLSDSDLIAERFRDTWTKLRVFEPSCLPEQQEYDRLCYLDADMMLRKDLDFIFEIHIPKDWIAASHACVCNRDHDPWAPKTWKPENCAFTPLDETTGLTRPTKVPHSSANIDDDLTEGRKHTYTLLNSGLFLFSPAKKQWAQIEQKFRKITATQLKLYKFPDQDFIREFFEDRWMSLPWSVNALKTMRYWHDNIWRDDSVVNLHYIVDKPWAGSRPIKVAVEDQRLGSARASPRSDLGVEGIDWQWSQAGFKGRDGETHSWWWKLYDDWKNKRQNNSDMSTTMILDRYVHGGKEAESKDMSFIGARVQAFATGQKAE